MTEQQTNPRRRRINAERRERAASRLKAARDKEHLAAEMLRQARQQVAKTIVELHDRDGLSYYEIGRLAGLSTTRAHQLARKAGGDG